MKTLIDALGLCEHCGVLLNLETMPAQPLNKPWKCPKCKKEIGPKSFGQRIIKGRWEKTRWVGKNGKWTTTKPRKDFNLGKLEVIIEPIRPLEFRQDR